jgi:choline dehydrogenase-like flavoprotein
LLQESSSSANSGTTNYIPTSQVNFFDYVIVGGGTAGCVIASRLAGYLPHKKILLIEGGPSDFNDDRVLQLKDWLTLLGGDLDYDYGTTEQPNGNHIFPLQIKHQETELSQEIHTFATPAQKCSAAAPHIIH